MFTAFIITVIAITYNAMVTASISQSTTDYPTSNPTSDPLCHNEPSGLITCQRLFGDNRPKIDVAILVDTDGQYLNANGESRLNQCNNQQLCITETLRIIKGAETVQSGEYPKSRISYIEFDKNGVTEILSLSDTDFNGEGNDVTRCEIEDFYGVIDSRCDDIYDSSNGNECNDNEPTKLYEALEYVQNNVFTEFYINRERYIIIFNNCQLPQTEIDAICTGFEDFVIRNDITVMMINQGSDGFSVDGDDYISCLVDNDDEQIYTSNKRRVNDFTTYGLDPVIVESICHESEESVSIPINHVFPRSWMSFDENGFDMMMVIFMVFMVLIFLINVIVCYHNAYYNGLYHNVRNDDADAEKSVMIEDGGYRD